MEWLIITAIVVASICVFAAFVYMLGVFVSFGMIFRVHRKNAADSHNLPAGQQYEERRAQMISLVELTETVPFVRVSTVSDDGLKLSARLYLQKQGAPFQIMFHGYQGNAIRDFCGGFQLAQKGGCNILLVDQRGHGESEGSFLSFGIKEKFDCIKWVEFVRKEFGADTPVVLVGVSMGAATVLMASGLRLPDNVVGIIADSSYSSPAAIIKKVTADLRFPPKLSFSLIKTGCRLLGRFDIRDEGPADAVVRCRVPVLFIHGEDDRFVPCDMSRAVFAACASPKKLVTVPGAGHALSYLTDPEFYSDAVDDFMRSVLPVR